MIGCENLWVERLFILAEFHGSDSQPNDVYSKSFGNGLGHKTTEVKAFYLFLVSFEIPLVY